MSVKINFFAFSQSLALSLPATAHISVSALHLNPLYLRNIHAPTGASPSTFYLLLHIAETVLRRFFLLDIPLSKIPHISEELISQDVYVQAAHSTQALKHFNHIFLLAQTIYLLPGIFCNHPLKYSVSIFRTHYIYIMHVIIF